MNSIKNVIEGNVKYSVDCDEFDPVIITVENINNKNKETYEYKLEYPNAIFGYDCLDVSNINKKLDEMINKLK